LLTPGTAFAADPDVTTSTVLTVTQTPTFGGATLNASVTVTPANTSNGAPTGGVLVSAGPGRTCVAGLSPVAGSPVDAAAGSCSIPNVPFGNYTVTAQYAGTASFGSSSGSAGATVGSAPAFTPYNPAQFARPGQFYSYTFHAVGSPVIRYSLAGPFWLHINPFTGTVSGTVPNFGGSFSYSVTATNRVGSASTRTIFVNVRQFAFTSLGTYLNCTSRVYTGQRGSCTLYVTDKGGSAAPNVTAQIALPSQLKADYCGSFGFGCRISGNTATENLGTLNPGQTKSLTVVFTAKTGFGIWGWHHGYRFAVKVVGSASSYGGFPFYGHTASSSTAYVTIIPRGWWA
jgi:Putative Ig domain